MKKKVKEKKSEKKGKNAEKTKATEKVKEPKMKDKIRFSLSAKLQLTMVWHLIGILFLINTIVFVTTCIFEIQRANRRMEAVSSALMTYPNQEEIVLWDSSLLLETEEELDKKGMQKQDYYFATSWGKKTIVLWDVQLFFPDNFHFFSDLKDVYYAHSVGEGQYLLYPIEHLLSRIIPQSIILGAFGLIFLVNSIIFFHKKVKKSLLPIDVLTQRVHEVGGYDMDVRLSTSGTQKEFVDLTFEINELLERIQKAYSEQTQFVSDASHELRTPISVIQGYADLLSRWGKDDPETLEESIQAIRSETRAMNLLVEQLLFLARGDHKSTKITMKPVNISELIQEVYEEAQMVDKEHVFEIKKEENIWIYGDESLLKQLIRIFLDNAIKYTPEEGKIMFQVTQHEGTAQFHIEDEGLGIVEEELPRIFDRFYRVDKTRNRKAGGTGLGLSIAQQILEIHKAGIEVTSRVGFGTRFTVSMPKWIPPKSIS